MSSESRQYIRRWADGNEFEDTEMHDCAHVHVQGIVVIDPTEIGLLFLERDVSYEDVVAVVTMADMLTQPEYRPHGDIDESMCPLYVVSILAEGHVRWERTISEDAMRFIGAFFTRSDLRCEISGASAFQRMESADVRARRDTEAALVEERWSGDQHA